MKRRSDSLVPLLLSLGVLAEMTTSKTQVYKLNAADNLGHYLYLAIFLVCAILLGAILVQEAPR